MVKGLLTYCEDHNRPLRDCLRDVHPEFKRGVRPGYRRMRGAMAQEILKGILGDKQGCADKPFGKVCGRVPATYWQHCTCGCGYSQRVCGRHSRWRWTNCPATKPPPPPGTGTVPWQQVGRSKTSG